MKDRMKILMLVIACASLALVGFKIPKNVYRMDQLEAAKAEAELKDKAITFVYTDEETTCPLCEISSLGVMDGLGSKSIVIYAEARTDWGKLPELVREAFSNPKAGKYIPMTVVVNTSITNVIAFVPYARGTDQKKLIKAANKAISEASNAEKKFNSSSSTSSDKVSQAAKTFEVKTWKSKTGFEIKASLVKEVGDYVVLKKEDGEELTVFLCLLTEEDQAYVTKLRNTP